MKLAIDNMDIKPDYVLSDAMKLDNISIPYKDIVHGDALSLSIAAGSIIAKVTRDRMMYELDKKYPQYGFAKHKGYPTKLHMENLKKYGVLDNYRFTYKPVSDLINNDKKELD
jgi:ribonuclease HII